MRFKNKEELIAGRSILLWVLLFYNLINTLGGILTRGDWIWMSIVNIIILISFLYLTKLTEVKK